MVQTQPSQFANERYILYMLETVHSFNSSTAISTEVNGAMAPLFL